MNSQSILEGFIKHSERILNTFWKKKISKGSLRYPGSIVETAWILMALCNDSQSILQDCLGSLASLNDSVMILEGFLKHSENIVDASRIFPGCFKNPSKKHRESSLVRKWTPTHPTERSLHHSLPLNPRTFPSRSYLTAGLLIRAEHRRLVVLEARVQVERRLENFPLPQRQQSFPERIRDRFREPIGGHTAAHGFHHGQAFEIEAGKGDVFVAGSLQTFDEGVQREECLVELPQELPVRFFERWKR